MLFAEGVLALGLLPPGPLIKLQKGEIMHTFERENLPHRRGDVFVAFASRAIGPWMHFF
jgi:hypothetical protein